MAIKGRQDRLTMLKTYLGPTVALDEAGWAANYEKTLAADLQVILATPDTAAPSRTVTATPKVDLAHPGWAQLVRTVEFTNWVKSQPAGVKNLAYSTNEDDAIRMLDLFKSRGSSSPSILYLSCELQWNIGSKERSHFDIAVDLTNKKMGKDAAEISEENIVSTGMANGYANRTTINRRSGAISIDLTGLGSMNGFCSKPSEKKF